MLIGICAKIRNGPLLRWRDERGLSQPKAAALAGVSHGTWNAVECFRFRDNPPFDAVEKIALCVGAEIEEIWPEELRGKWFETRRIAYRETTPQLVLSELPARKLLSVEATPADVDKIDASEIVADALSDLTQRERSIIECMYGVGARSGQPPTTLQECGRLHNISKERVRQLEMRARFKMEAAIRRGELPKPDPTIDYSIPAAKPRHELAGQINQF